LESTHIDTPSATAQRRCVWVVLRLASALPWALAIALLAFPGAVYTLMLPTLLLLVFVDHNNPLIAEKEAGWPLVIYFWLVLCGFVVISNKRLLGSIQKLRWLSLVVAILSFVFYVFMVTTTSAPVFGTGRFALITSLRVFASWCMVLTLMGFGIQYINARKPFLNYANEAVLPFYILHQTVLLGVGYFAVQWSVPDLLKWVVILLVAFGVIMSFYEYLVRRFNVMRFLFGMKLIAPRPTMQTYTPEIAQ